MRIIKFALPLAAMVCFGALGLSAEEATSKKSSTTAKNRSASDSGARKKNSSSKRSAKARKSTKSSKAKRERSRAKAAASQDWIDELPAVELPEEEGPSDDELLEPVSEPAP